MWVCKEAGQGRREGGVRIRQVGGETTTTGGNREGKGGERMVEL